MRQRRDRRRAEADERAGAVGRVALEVAREFARPLGDREWVSHQRKMIEADRMVAMTHQRSVDGIVLPQPLVGIGQRRRVDQLLMALHLGHVCVAEDGQALRREFDHAIDGVADI